MSPRERKPSDVGRPRMLRNPVNVVLRIEKELLEAAKVSAREQGVSLSHVMRAALRRFVGGQRPRLRHSKEKYVW
jgi:hypothetical protein